MNFLNDLTNSTKKNIIQTLLHLPDFQIVKCVEFLRYHTQRLILKHYFINVDFSIIFIFLFFRISTTLSITLVFCIVLFVVSIVVMTKHGSMMKLKEKLGCSQITKSGSYNTNKSIIQIDIPTQGHSSRGTWFPPPLFLATIEKNLNI